jgi:hypothetical protein
VHPLNWLALEVDYLDLGSTNITKAGYMGGASPGLDQSPDVATATCVP